MSRIRVQPEELETLAKRFRQIAGELHGLGSQVTGAMGALSWESNLRTGVEAEVDAARAQAHALVAQAEAMSAFLRDAAARFSQADHASQTDFVHAIEGMVAGIFGGLGKVLSGVGHGAWGLGGLIFGPVSTGLGLGWVGQLLPGVLHGLKPSGGGGHEGAHPAAAGGGVGGALGGAGGVAGGGPVAAPPADSAEALRQEFHALGWTNVEQWAPLIYQVAKEKGLPPELIAAVMRQESGGDASAGRAVGYSAGKGLMQIEFSAHYGDIPGETREEKNAWIMKPENNVRFAAEHLLKPEVDKWTDKYGPDEGMKRAIQYYNYGSGAAETVEANSARTGNWQQAVDDYARDNKDGAGNLYGDHTYAEKVFPEYQKAVAERQHHAEGATVSHDVTPPAEGLAPPQHSAPTDYSAAPTYDGSHAAPGTIGMERGHPVMPPLTNHAGERSVGAYNDVINQFGVESNGRYKPGEWTYCNIFVWDVTQAMGAEIPHWVDENGNGMPPGKPALELNADRVAGWLEHSGSAHGWRAVSADEAQQWANQGKPAVVAWDSRSDDAGHVAMVRPGDAKPGDPIIAQAGGHNYNETTVSQGFGSHAAHGKYYVHD